MLQGVCNSKPSVFVHLYMDDADGDDDNDDDNDGDDDGDDDDGDDCIYIYIYTPRQQLCDASFPYSFVTTPGFGCCTAYIWRDNEGSVSF